MTRNQLYLERAREVVICRAGGLCERCGLDVTTRYMGMEGGQVHHRQPRGMGGTYRPEIHSPANLTLLCATCHAWVESNRTASTAAGWLVPSTADPREIPVEIRGLGFRYLDPDGTYQEGAP